MSAPLSNKQKRYLADLSRRAFRRQCAITRGANQECDSSAKAEAAFRHAQVAKACGKNGLTLCGQNDYGAVKAHFLQRLGEDGKALKALVHQEDNSRRQAEYKLTEAMKEFHFNAAYVEAICQAQFKCTVANAETAQLWNLYFTLRNRGRNKQKHAQQQELPA